MFLQFFTAVTKNAQFDSALSRTLNERKVLQSRLESLEVEGYFNTVLLGIFDEPETFFELKNQRNKALLVNVGYNVGIGYLREEDEKIIGMIAGWLRRTFRLADGYAARRDELLSILNIWEGEAVKRIVDSRRVNQSS